MTEIIVKNGHTIRQVMKKMSDTGNRCLVILDNDNRLEATITDGDIRKAILNGNEFSTKIESIYNSNPVTLKENTFNENDIRDIFLKNKFDIIPVVDKNNKLKKILRWESYLVKNEKSNQKMLNIPVVIMTGGLGKRLEPFTKVLPKSLIPIHDKPVIEHIA